MTRSHDSLSSNDAPTVLHRSGPDIDSDLQDVVDRAGRRIAPLWPLDHFVAVNPWVGMTDLDFVSAARRTAQVAGGRMAMPRDWYAARIEEGRILEPHLRAALDAAHERAADDPGERDLLPADLTELRRALTDESAHADPAESLLPTVADAAQTVTGHAWGRFVTERVSHWAAGYVDDRQSTWQTPFREAGLWSAWRAEASIDRTPEYAGIPGFRHAVAALPEDPRAAIDTMIGELAVPEDALELYLHRLLMRVGGWAGFFRWRLWEAELRDGDDAGLREFTAILLAWEVALLRGFESRGVADEWSRCVRNDLSRWPDVSGRSRDLQIELLLQDALERAHHEAMIGRFEAAASEGAGRAAPNADARPDVQAAFCIDVRSEVLRRSLEAQSEGIRTVGFAGFFGFALEVLPVGEDHGASRCPVLLTPSATIRERVAGGEALEVARRRGLRRATKDVWTSFKMGAVSCFGFVGPVGLAYARRLVTDGFGWSRPVPHPSSSGLSTEEAARVGPDLDPEVSNGRSTGLDAATRLDTAEGVLRAMSLTENFARIVLLAGHGSTTVNNPHATGLDCGACGGHTGEANARVAAAVLSDPAVREGLIARGIEIPADTLFLAGLHDTTTDEVKIFGVEDVPETHAADVASLRTHLKAAGRRARAERAPSLGISAPRRSAATDSAHGDSIDRAVDARSRNWSEVRPEWGLAGCAAFVAAPRHRTREMDLGGRSFLHDYTWQADGDFGILELIMTAPMVVASWISLQYYGSTVDNRVFGSGNKTLQNVVAGRGVLEGNGGDLRTGLPSQSVHDGNDVAHEPLRLNVVIEAPIEAMTGVIERHPEVRALLDHGWLHLWAMDEEGRLAHRYDGELEWSAVERMGGPSESRTNAVA